MKRLPRDWPFARPRRFPAVDGKTCPPPAWWKESAGAWGCYRSHLSVIEDCLNNGRESVLILEDDAVFPPEFTAGAMRFLQALPQDWQMLYLGGQLLKVHLRPPLKVNDEVYRPYNVNRNHAWALRGEGLRAAYRWLSTLDWYANYHVDHHLGRLHERGEVPVYAPRRWLVGQLGGASDISGQTNDTMFWNHPEDCLRRGQRQLAIVLGSLLAVSLLAKELGLGGRGQVLSVVFTAMLSMGILQASSGQNDYVLAYWLTLFSYFALAAGKELHWQNSAAAGMALGLAILTKATAYVIGLPFLICLLISCFRRMGWRAIGPLGAIALAVCVVNAGHWYRNTMLLGDPLGARGAGLSGGEYKISNDSHTPAAVLSVALRNAALQLGSTNSLWNKLLETGVLKSHAVLGMDANDPATTYGGESGRKLAIGFLRDESYASDPLHFVILLVASGWLLTQKAQPIRWQLWLTLLAALVFCVYLK